MNVIVLKGLVVLTVEIAPTRYIEVLFKFPFYIGVGALLMYVNSRVVPLSMVDIVGQIKTKYVKLIIYFLLSVMLATFFYLDGRYF